MKKILFVSPRNPFSGRYSGDVIRAKKFIYFLSRNNYVKVISLDTQSSRKKESNDLLAHLCEKESLMSKMGFIFMLTA